MSKKSGDAIASRDIVNCIASRSGSCKVAVIDRGHSRLARTTLTSVPMTKICTIRLTYARSPMVDAKGPYSPDMTAPDIPVVPMILSLIGVALLMPIAFYPFSYTI